MKLAAEIPMGAAEHIIRAYGAPGVTLHSLAALYHTSTNRIRAVVNGAGKLRGMGKGRSYEMPAERIVEICTRYEAGATMEALMRECRIGEVKLLEALTAGGLEPRRPGPRGPRGA